MNNEFNWLTNKQNGLPTQLIGWVGLALVLWAGWTLPAQAQKADSSKWAFYFRGDISLTNNGFSIIPAFTLGRPVAILELAAGSRRLSFEPQLRNPPGTLA